MENDKDARRALQDVGGEPDVERPQWHVAGRKRSRRRCLVVPKSEEDFDRLEDAYSNSNHWDEDAIGRFQSSVFANFEFTSTRCRRRPLPSTQVLMSSMQHSASTPDDPVPRTQSTLMSTFYESIGLRDIEGSKINDVGRNAGENRTESFSMNPNNAPQQPIDAIYDPSRSTMKLGHHRRYLQLTKNSQQQSSHNAYSQRKELQKLRKMVREEQASYRLALDEFHARHKSRYLIGFEPTSSLPNSSNNARNFCRWACHKAESINQEWKKVIGRSEKNVSSESEGSIYLDRTVTPKHYGKVRQTLALHSGGFQSSLDVQDLSCSVVHESSPKRTSQLPSSQTRIPEFTPKDQSVDGVNPEIPSPTLEFVPGVKLLRDDKKALELAVQHSASIVTTSETMETLLRLPGEYSTKWMISCMTKTVKVPQSKPGSLSSVRILDIPIGQPFSSPRSCLERGLQEGLYQMFQQTDQHESHGVTTSKDDQKQELGSTKEKTQPPATQYFYSLWILPSKITNESRKPIRVIIRTMIRLKDSVSKLPVRLRARVEYFSTPCSGDVTRDSSRSHREIPNSYERSLWILDQVLFGHQAFCLQYRIDPTTCKILGWDTTSVAHAFAESANDENQNGMSLQPDGKRVGPMNHWITLIQLLRSISAIDIPRAILCLPGIVGERNDSVIDRNQETQVEKANHEILTTQNENSRIQHFKLDPFSVSVHGPCNEPSTRHIGASSQPQNLSTEPTISLGDDVLERAGTVMLGDLALRDCRRDWEWNKLEQVPYTFPVRGIEETTP